VALPPETIDWLRNYPWPGNVRELKNALEGGAVLCRNGVIRPSDLNLTGLPEAPPLAAAGSSSLSLEISERNAILRALEQAGWVQKDAAELLGISRRALHYKIKKFGIEIASRRPVES
jgi:DNA-binding NtrC family response regulator